MKVALDSSLLYVRKHQLSVDVIKSATGHNLFELFLFDLTRENWLLYFSEEHGTD